MSCAQFRGCVAGRQRKCSGGATKRLEREERSDSAWRGLRPNDELGIANAKRARPGHACDTAANRRTLATTEAEQRLQGAEAL